MNILYVSNLKGNKWTGPNQSVPRQIRAQSKIDNVFWFNINNTENPEWNMLTKYHSTNDFQKISLDSLPTPFNKPDLIIFQGLYCFPFCKIIFEAWYKTIPYIIVTRGALPKQAQKNKRLKKFFANLVFFKRFVNKAKAIHYLTDQEYLDSGEKWNKNYFIIPNGIEIPQEYNYVLPQNGIKAVYIGRTDIYQKGLDLLLEACNQIKPLLLSNRVTIDLYGPDMDGAKSRLYDLIESFDLGDIISLNEGVFDAEKQQVLTNSDLFIMTSRFEGHPMGLIEALSYGLPSLVTKGTNMSKEVLAQDAGWVADDNVESIKDAFIKMLEEREKLKLKSKNALSLATNYDWDTIAQITHQKYLELQNNYNK
ncbi:glycosyl transferase, group 1 [Alkalihalophilus pseudofirmus OF4]|uniref:Glycosyl transferase, group 1 n=1 Tax=Alkalihalophilus pseudofirmus (strain ATCC BAA-2126 / JCM 17055 / OF4) TaxID=398511 RepID=D3G093_ALKPO|nr:glycosyltransferase [Alkalihalophilus pseudofirmus]ADC49368.1 glycosyl transferase, group 1 [Alkalihalophilus pseudofirmus OF4]